MGIFGMSKEERQEEQRITVRKIADQIMTSDKLRDRIIAESAAKFVRQNFDELETKIDAAIRGAVNGWRKEAAAKLDKMMQDWIDDPLIMQRMRAMEITHEDFREEMGKQVSEILRLLNGLLGSGEDRKQNPVIAELLERVEALESYTGINQQTRQTQHC